MIIIVVYNESEQ